MESSQNQEKEISLKIIILGDSNVGKTSILLKYVDGYFPTIYVATIGVEYKVKKITINGVDINLHIWDTAGQERFRSITKSFMQNADGIIYVYDMKSENIIRFFDEVVKIVKWIEPHEHIHLSYGDVINYIDARNRLDELMLLHDREVHDSSIIISKFKNSNNDESKSNISFSDKIVKIEYEE